MNQFLRTGFDNFLSDYGTNLVHTKIWYYSSIFKATGTTARSICKSFGLDFASFETPFEDDYVFDLLSKNKKKFPREILIGGYSLKGGTSTDSWYWLSSGNHAVKETLKFAEGEPNDTDGSERCLVLYNLEDDFYLNDINCNFERNFICQKIVLK